MKILSKFTLNQIAVDLIALRIMAEHWDDSPDTIGKAVEAIANLSYEIGGMKMCDRVERGVRRWEDNG